MSLERMLRFKVGAIQHLNMRLVLSVSFSGASQCFRKCDHVRPMWLTGSRQKKASANSGVPMHLVANWGCFSSAFMAWSSWTAQVVGEHQHLRSGLPLAGCPGRREHPISQLRKVAGWSLGACLRHHLKPILVEGTWALCNW